MDQETAEELFGSRVHGPVEDGAEQWEYGANRLTDMACKASDELEWERTDDGEFVVRNTKYGEEHTSDELWRALWILERDIRIEYGDSRTSPVETAQEREKTLLTTVFDKVGGKW